MFGEIFMTTLIVVLVAGLVAFFLYSIVIGPMLGRKELARMEKELPRLGEKHGLKFRQARSTSRFGRLVGMVRGHEVEINPDESQQFLVRVRGNIRCTISSENLDREPEDNQVHFSFSDQDLNRYFKTRHASPELARRLEGSIASFDSLAGLVREHGKELRLLTVNDRDIYASVKQRWATDFGEERRAYITPEQLGRLLPALVNVAEELGA